ncbi:MULTISPECIES: universal stress protein [Salinibaculum]|uniref:universal stress protein n=1 Tax=Salinibaculum TaxID=2732368 RepID=UPI0030CFD255
MTDVLLGIDQNVDRAVTQAETMLDLFDATDLDANLLHDFVDNPEGASVKQVDSVKRARDILEDAGAAVTLREGSGDPAQSILDMAEQLDVDLICIAGRKRSPAGKALFGSVSQSVILNAERPVLTCGSPGDEA